jgi:hypothetical protein
MSGVPRGAGASHDQIHDQIPDDGVSARLFRERVARGIPDDDVAAKLYWEHIGELAGPGNGSAAPSALGLVPTSACWECGALRRPDDLWVGKRSGAALCEDCIGKWEAAGRARRNGEF